MTEDRTELTRREQFAMAFGQTILAQALESGISASENAPEIVTDDQLVALSAVTMADALIATLDGESPPD